MADSDVDVVITATDNASKVISLVSEAFGMITNAVTDTVKAYTDYGAEVKDMSTFLGTSSEQTSRLIALSDDAGVSYDTVRLAAKQMVQDGLQPTAENLGKLSDQFLAIKDPVQASQFLIDNFGRSGQQMALIMSLGSDKIKQMNSSIESGLIIDDKEAAAIEKTREEQNAFNDAMTSMKYETAQKLLDIFNALPGPLQSVVQVMGIVGQSGVLGQFSQLAIIVVELSKAGGVTGIISGIGTAASGAAVGLWAMLAPLIPLAAALALLYAEFKAGWVDQAITAAQKLFAIGGGALLTAVYPGESLADATASVYTRLNGKASGGSVSYGVPVVVGENGAEVFVPNSSGSIVPNSQLGGTVVQVSINYSPGISLDSRSVVENQLGPLLLSYFHKKGLITNG